MSATDTKPVAPVTGGRYLVRRGPSRRWMTVFLALLAVSVVAAAVLAYVGVETVRSSRAGQVVSTVTDPAAPGFEALLEPTPTLALLHVDGGELRSVAVLALASGDRGGSALLLAPRAYGHQGDFVSFADAVAFGGRAESILPSLQRSVGFGISEVAIVDDARWTELVAPVSPLEVDNPSATGPFPEGPITLPAEDVGAYLAATNDGEHPELAVLRQRAFLRAWLDAIAESGDATPVPGEVGSGIGRFLQGLASGPHRIDTAPTTEISEEGVPRTYVDAAAMSAIISDLVPFPVAGVPGGRVRVRLLDGTGDPNHVQRAAPLVVPANAEIVVVGNADAFDYEETEIRYHNPMAKASATALREGLGAGRLVDDPRQTDAFDVTIVLGPDL